MSSLLEEVSAELNTVATIKQATKDMTERQLTLAQSLLEDADDKPYKEKLALLKSIKSVQDNALATLKCIDDSYNMDDVAEVRSATHQTQRQYDAAKFIH